MADKRSDIPILIYTELTTDVLLCLLLGTESVKCQTNVTLTVELSRLSGIKQPQLHPDQQQSSLGTLKGNVCSQLRRIGQVWGMVSQRSVIRAWNEG